MPDLHTDDWLDARFDAAVDDLDRALTAPRPLTGGEFRRHAGRHSAGRAALAVGVVGGTIGALALVARDSGSQAPMTAAVAPTVTSIVTEPARPTPQREAWEAAVSTTLEAVGWPYLIESTVFSVDAPGQVGGATVTATLDSGLLVFDIVPWAPGEYTDNLVWQRGVAGVTTGGEQVAEGTLFVSDAPPNRSASIVTPLALVSVTAQQTDLNAIGGLDNFAEVARLLARAVPSVLAGEQISPASLTASVSLEALTPSQEYYTAVWDAREIVIGNCLARLGYDYQPRPNDAAGTGGTWDEWNQWLNLQAADPDFEIAFQGGPDQQAGGCQAEAYLTVHGPGEEAYSKAATLENELRGDINWLDLDQTAVDRWIAEHVEDVERVHAELDEELQTARRIIENTSS